MRSFQHNLAGHRLQRLEHGGELQVLQVLADGLARLRHPVFPGKVRIHPIELPHLAFGSP